MRKTISISIAGQLFYIEEHAYADLDKYLTSIRAHFKTFEDSEEIVSDIETRIAERFIDKLGKRRKVLNKEDVTDLITHMGTVEDFKEFSEDAPPKPKTSTERKRLYRDTDDVMLAGVASGIAKYFDIDPTIVRLLFVASLILGGSGILIYIVLWIVLPEASTTTQKLEMRGKSPTIKQMEQLIRENVPEVKKKMQTGWLRKIIQFPFLILRSAVKAISKALSLVVPAVLRVIGVAVILAASLGLAALSFSAVMLFTNAWSAYMDIPVRELMGPHMYEFLVVSGYFVGFFPLIAVLLIGSSLVAMRNNLRMSAMLTMLGLWIVAITSTAVLVAKDAPVLTEKFDEYVEAHSTEVQESVDLEAFTSIEAHGGYKIIIEDSPRQDVFVSGSQRGWDATELVVENETLSISKKPSHWFCIFCLSDTMTITITLPEVENIRAYGGSTMQLQSINLVGELSTSGGARILATSIAVPDQLTLSSTGGSRIELQEVALTAVEVSISGGSRMILDGTGVSMAADASGGSRLDARNLAVTDVDVSLSGGARAEVNAEVITGSVSGGAWILYPAGADISELEEHISGASQEY